MSIKNKRLLITWFLCFKKSRWMNGGKWNQVKGTTQVVYIGLFIFHFCSFSYNRVYVWDMKEQSVRVPKCYFERLKMGKFFDLLVYTPRYKKGIKQKQNRLMQFKMLRADSIFLVGKCTCWTLSKHKSK